VPRLWWLPAAAGSLAGANGHGMGAAPEATGCCGVGLVWAAHRGGIDLGTPTG
jgi:hypothetical protein